MSFQQSLQDIADPHRPLRSIQLADLTALGQDERHQFAEVWPAVPVERRREIVDQLATLAEDNIDMDFGPVFSETLNDTDAAVRIGAIQGLWEYEGREIVPQLVAILRDDDNPAVRAEAALALGRFVLMGEFDEARPRDVEQVTDALRGVVADPAESVEVRGRAVESLGASSQPWARDIIHDAHDSGDRRLTASAVHAMGRSADNYWMSTLIDELHSDDPEMRYEAVAACGMIEDEEAVPYLIEMLSDEDAEVREQVLLALGAIGGEEAIEALREQAGSADDRMREAALQALEEAEFGDDPLGFRG
jgi:HEAT repeat protein